MYVRSALRPIESDSPTLEWTLALASRTVVRVADGLAPAARTLTVLRAGHPEGDAHHLLEGRSNHVFHQPSARDTAVAIYVALAMIKRWTPNAIVTITPTEIPLAHVEQIRIARGIASRMRDKVVVIGAKGVLGNSVLEVPNVRTIARFVETATTVLCGTAAAVWALGRTAQPELINLLDSLSPLIGMPDEFDAIDHIYRAVPPISFARDVLERFPDRLMALVPVDDERGVSRHAAMVVDQASAG